MPSSTHPEPPAVPGGSPAAAAPTPRTDRVDTTASAAPTTAETPGTPADVPAQRRTALNEDWAATIVGLLILGVVLAGVWPGWLVP